MNDLEPYTPVKGTLSHGRRAVRGKQIVITAVIAAVVVVGFSMYQKRAAGVSTGR